MKIYATDKRRTVQNIQIGDYHFKGVTSFRYLGALLKNNNSMLYGKNHRIATASRAQHKRKP